MRIPWDLIIKQAPALVKAAGDLAIDTRSRRAAIVATTDLQTLRAEVAQLASDEQSQAMLIKELTSQLDILTKAVRATELRGLLGLLLSALGLVLSVLALWVALSR